MSHKFVLPIAIVLAVCGCSAHATHAPAASAVTAAAAPVLTIKDLDGTHWRFIEVAGAKVPAAVVATMRLQAGHASGKAGCNAYGAAYQIAADGSAHFRQGISTKMACLTPPGAMQVEHGVFAALRETVKVEIHAGQLWMLDAAGKPVAKLALAAKH